MQPTPSSRESDPEPGGLFDAVLARGGVRREVTDRAWLRALLDFEAALARALAATGFIADADAAAITRACEDLVPDPTLIGAEAAHGGNPVIPLVRLLTTALPDRAAGSVHRGATSQDALDTAAMLVCRRAIAVLLEDLAATADTAAALALAHRDTLVAGRTLLQHALPTTFGLKAAGWLLGLDAAHERLAAVGDMRLVVQLGGAAGTLAALGNSGVEVLDRVAGELGLGTPVAPWHTERSRIVEIAAALGETSAAVGRIARDLLLLAQTEVAEVHESSADGRGTSSTLPHKRNPIAAVAASACAAQAPGLVATLMAAAAGHEHERAAGSWHAEWRPLSALLESTGSAIAWLRDSMENMTVDTERMRVNLELTGGLMLAERITVALTPALGRLAAHDLVTEACDKAFREGRRLAAVLAADSRVSAHLPVDRIPELLDPSGYVGSAPDFVDRALLAHEQGRRTRERGIDG